MLDKRRVGPPPHHLDSLNKKLRSIHHVNKMYTMHMAHWTFHLSNIFTRGQLKSELEFWSNEYTICLIEIKSNLDLARLAHVPGSRCTGTQVYASMESL